MTCSHLVAAGSGILHVEVIIPAAPHLPALVCCDLHTEILVIAAYLGVVQTQRVVLLDAVVAGVVGGGGGGRHRHRRGVGAVVARQPVVAFVPVTETHRGVVIARPVQAVLTHQAAILAVLPVVPQRVPAPLPLQGPALVVGVHGEAPGFLLLTRGRVEDVQGVGGVLHKPVITGQRLGPPGNVFQFNFLLTKIPILPEY